MNNFTVEEINLMCFFDTSNKSTLLYGLEISKKDIFDNEMKEIVQSTIDKLKRLTDSEFEEIGFFISEEFDSLYEQEE